MIKMAVSSMVILMVLFTGVLRVDGSDYPQQKALENALIREETLNTIRQVFFPIFSSRAQEVWQVRIRICVKITVDQNLNSSSNDSCIASDLKKINTSLCWKFLWTDSALLSLITVDQLVAFDVLATAVFNTAIGKIFFERIMNVSLPLICSDMPNDEDIKTSLIFLLSWSKSYARHNGVPPQWEETDKGYIQELYEWRYVAESTYNKHNVHYIRVGMIISFTFLNMLILIIELAYGKRCYLKIHRVTSGSIRLAAVTWAFMITSMLVNSFYLLCTIVGLSYFKDLHPRVWACLISDADWCASIKSTQLYSDEVASVLVKLTVVPFTIVVELIIAVRLTSHTLLPFPCSMATTPQCCSFRIGKRITRIILIWNAMVFTQILFGVILLPFGVLLMIIPVTTISVTTTFFLLLFFFLAVSITYVILQWCNPFTFKRCCSLLFCFHVFTLFVILFLGFSTFLLYYYIIGLGVQPWSVKGSILSLLPSFLVTPLLWFAKKYFFKKDRAIEDVRDGLSMTTHHQSTGHQEKTELMKEEEEEEVNDEEQSLVSVV